MNDVADVIWTNVFGHTPPQWIVQGRLSESHAARQTADGLLQLMTALGRYPHRVLLSSHDTPSAFVNAATYPGFALARAVIPHERNFLHVPWPEPAPEDALIIVDYLDPKLWNTFQAWRGQRPAVVVLLTNNPAGWIPPLQASWVLNVTHGARPRYRAPVLEEWDYRVAAEEASAASR